MVYQVNDKVSKIMLVYLRHRYNIMMGIICVVNVLALTVLTVMLDTQLSRIKSNSESYFKGTSCVQLIPDDKITKQLIIDCMNKNDDNKEKDYDFEELGTLKVTPVKDITVIAYKREEHMDEVATTQVVNEEQEERGEGKVPRIIRRIREDGVEEFQSEGDTLWQSLAKVDE